MVQWHIHSRIRCALQGLPARSALSFARIAHSICRLCPLAARMVAGRRFTNATGILATAIKAGADARSAHRSPASSCTKLPGHHATARSSTRVDENLESTESAVRCDPVYDLISRVPDLAASLYGAR